MYYHLILVLDENTFRSSALTYTLQSINQDNNGYSVPEIISQTGIKTGEREIFLGNGMFTPTNNENKVHSYTLKLYFPKIEHFEHGIDQGKIFKAHIETREGKVYPGYNEEKGVNHPVLFTGMTPVKWDGITEIKTTEDDPDWYDYDEKRWANAKSQDGSYWVWIPRYAYKIETCYHTSGEDCYNLTGKYAGDINVKFLKSTTNITEDNTIIESSGYVPHVKDTSMHHFLHPAFQFNSEELGFWVAKFEPSTVEGVATGTGSCNESDNTNEKTIKIVPNDKPWRCVSMLNVFEVVTNMKHQLNIYGWLSSEIDPHIMTNHEWGAVAYLSKSKYGAESEIWNNSYHYYQTGCSGSSVDSASTTTCTEYHTENGQKASTTHNIYGIYDMSGGAWERVMANYNKLTGSSGFTNEDMHLIEPKYFTKYITKPEDMFNEYGMDFDLTIYGDAVYETSFDPRKHYGDSTEGNVYGSWYQDNSNMPRLNYPWFYRGGRATYDTPAGIFNYYSAHAGLSSVDSFRLTLSPI